MTTKTRLKPELEATIGEWDDVSCTAIVKMGCDGVTATALACDGFGNTNLRYFHSLERTETHQLIDVGIDCSRARVDESDEEIPRLVENEVKHKEKWRIHYGRPGRCWTTPDILQERGKL